MSRSSFLCLLYFLFYALYLILGGLAFAAIEGPGEQALKQEVALARQAFLAQYPTVSDNDMEELIQEVIKASNRGVSASKNDTGGPNWSLGQSLFFSCTLITTIGYGHVTPLSKEGKLFCMAYAVVGIPMTLIMLTAVVERLMLPTRSLLEWLQRRLGRVYRPLGVRLIHLTLLVVFRVTVFMLIPAGVFAYIEPEWDYLDSLYYCFISLTTIGLGDYIPGDSPNQPYRPLYKVATTCYLLVGLMFMVLTLTVFHDIPQLNLGTFFALQKDTNTRDLEKVRLQDPDGSGPKYTEKKTSPQD